MYDITIKKRRPSAAIRNGIFVVCMLTSSASSMGQTMSVPEFLAEKDKWNEWSLRKKTLSVSGRYEGRLSKQFRFSKLPMLITPQRITVLPKDVKAGQRVTVSGLLHRSGTRFGLEVTRIAVGSTDTERMIRKVDRNATDKPDVMYKIADEYAEIAAFYDDQELTFNVGKLREKAFMLQRDQSRNDSAGLVRLAKQAESTGVPTALVAAIRFQSLVVAANSDKRNIDEVLADIRLHLEGWDRVSAMLEQAAEERFLQNPVIEYETADRVSRQRMHRRLYRLHRLPQILNQLKPDASNGPEIAQRLETELPEESKAIEETRKRFLDARLAAVPRLNRNQLEELAVMLRDFGREKETNETISRWLRAQEKRLDNGELDGILAVADEQLFAFERWKNPVHRDAGVERLKKAWFLSKDSAPKDAALIEQRLGRLGWTRLHDKWLTDGQITNLPRNDVELAMREGRVVAGMKPHQVVGTLGEPNRKIRVISARYVEEIWIFGEDGSTAITVHLQRSRHSRPVKATVTQVSRTANR
ncbi:MAG: hypothetical protein P8J37_21465 [Fuerstiella sp.]|nr:hypothetical protein [Fuerstiella sp.]